MNICRKLALTDSVVESVEAPLKTWLHLNLKIKKDKEKLSDLQEKIAGEQVR